MYRARSRRIAARHDGFGCSAWHARFLGGVLCRARECLDSASARRQRKRRNHCCGQPAFIRRDRDFFGRVFHLHLLYSPRPARRYRGGVADHSGRHYLRADAIARVVRAPGSILRHANALPDPGGGTRQLSGEYRRAAGMQPHVVHRCRSAGCGHRGRFASSCTRASTITRW
jgi:hypothetical protein